MVDSVEGEGTTFRIFLPLARTADVPTSVESQVGSVDRSLMVLLVEDMEPVRRPPGRLLESLLGHQVCEAETAEDAMRTWEEHGDVIEVVIADVRLGRGASGPELADLLRQGGAAVPVLFVSGGYDFEPRKAPRHIRESFLSKPLHRKTMAAALTKLFPED